MHRKCKTVRLVALLLVGKERLWLLLCVLVLIAVRLAVVATLCS